MSYRRNSIGSSRAVTCHARTSQLRQRRRFAGQGRQADRRCAVLLRDRRPGDAIPTSSRGTDPGMFTVNPNGTINGKTAKQVYSFTHFDAWAYGTNFFTISMFKSDHNDPAAPCINAGVSVTFAPANCAGATEIYGLFRSTFGFNEIFNTKAFSMGPLHNVSFEVGMDANTENRLLWRRQARRRRRSAVRLRPALQGLLQRRALGVLGVLNHNSFTQCNSGFRRPASGRDLPDRRQHSLQADLGGRNQLLHGSRLPAENMQYFSISGRAGLVRQEGLPTPNRCRHPANGVFNTAVEFNSRTDPSDLRRHQGRLGRQVLALRRRLGRLSLLAEQVRPRPQPSPVCTPSSPAPREQQLLHRELALFGHHREVLRLSVRTSAQL